MTIDIVFSINKTLALPAMVTANSILKNTARPDSVRFNIVIPPGRSSALREIIDVAFPERRHQFRLKEYLPPDFLQNYLDIKFQATELVRKNSRYMQYSRLFIKSAFPDITRLIYFDADIIVLGDVQELFSQGNQLNSSHYVGAVPQFFPALFYFSNPFKVWHEIRQFKKTFNSGVLLTDLTFWTNETYEKLKYYLDLDVQYNYKLYNLGDETVLNLMFKRNYLPLDHCWNRCGYGNARFVTWFLKRDLTQTNVIHWSGGHHKPWRSKNIVFGQLWQTYKPEGLENSEAFIM